jgi:trehalose 6-phosphate synthase
VTPEVLLVSNRGPRSFQLDGDGTPVLAGTGGGLAGTLHPLLAGSGATWIAASMNEADRVASVNGLMSEDGLRIVTLAPDEALYRQAYDVISNGTLWFCHHHLFDLARRPRFDRHWHAAWDGYRELNQRFAESVAAEAGDGAVVLVQDYHLALLGDMVARSRPDLRTVHFSHTPFADPEMLRVLPGAAVRELLTGMAGFGACGFHTARWEAGFRAACDDPSMRPDGAAAPRTFVSPLGPDPDSLAAEAATPAVARARAELDEMVGDRRLIVRVDRVELSKNLLRGFWAFEELFETRPDLRGAVVMLALVYPSREGLAEYLAYRSEIEHTVARINDVWSTPGWTPIVLDVADDRDRSVAALTRYDALLVNPIRDGLNLVAKEGPLVNTVDGAVVLSSEAGAWEELAPAVVTVNPFDVTGTAEGLARALEMAAPERAERAAALRRTVLGRTAADWLADQFAAAEGLPRGEGVRPAGG